MAKPVATEPASTALTPNELLRLFSVLSHDLKSPIFTIDGFSDLLLADYGPKLDDEGKEFLQRIRSGAQHMRKILDEMSNLLKLLGRPSATAAIDLKEVVEELRLKFNYLLEESGTSLQVTQPLPPVQGDLEKVRAALGALLSNALTFNDRPTGERTISIEASEKDGQVRCCVKDNGIGIDPRYLDQIFEAGLKLDKSRGAGPGFGLYLVRKAVESEGGSVTVDTTLGQGSTFCVLLPSASPA